MLLCPHYSVNNFHGPVELVVVLLGCDDLNAQGRVEVYTSIHRFLVPYVPDQWGTLEQEEEKGDLHNSRLALSQLPSTGAVISWPSSRSVSRNFRTGMTPAG